MNKRKKGKRLKTKTHKKVQQLNRIQQTNKIEKINELENEAIREVNKTIHNLYLSCPLLHQIEGAS